MGCAPSVATSSRYDDLYSIVPKTRAFKTDFDALGIRESGMSTIYLSVICLSLNFMLSLMRMLCLFIYFLCTVKFSSFSTHDYPLVSCYALDIHYLPCCVCDVDCGKLYHLFSRIDTDSSGEIEILEVRKSSVYEIFLFSTTQIDNSLLTNDLLC